MKKKMYIIIVSIAVIVVIAAVSIFLIYRNLHDSTNINNLAGTWQEKEQWINGNLVYVGLGDDKLVITDEKDVYKKTRFEKYKTELKFDGKNYYYEDPEHAKFTLSRNRRYLVAEITNYEGDEHDTENFMIFQRKD